MFYFRWCIIFNQGLRLFIAFISSVGIPDPVDDNRLIHINRIQPVH